MSSHLLVGNPTHPVYPYPAPAHSSFSANDLLISSVDVEGISLSSDTCTTPMAGMSEDPLVWHTIASPRISLEQLELIQGKEWLRTTIEMLSEDTLLEIFDFYRLNSMKQSRGRPWKWYSLAHVCRKWRRVISMSPRRLALRIPCEVGAPIESIMGPWSTLPLYVRYYGPTSKSLPNNVVVALRHPDRVCEIDLILPSSLIRSVFEVIREPLQTLECIQITVENATGPSMLLREAFLGGSAPQLRRIKLDGIALPFSAIRQVLLSTNNLIELHLANIPNDVYLSPDDLVTGLTTLVQLRRLTVGFHSPDSSPPPTMTPPPLQRITLSSLSILSFHGASEYLEEFVARIDLPALGKITVKLFNDIIFEIPQFFQFILRLKAPGFPTWVIVKHSKEFVSVSIDQVETPMDERCLLEMSCRRLDWQLSFVTQISSQLSPFLSSVRLLSIHKGCELPAGEEDVDPTQWLELFQPFTHLTQVHVWEKRLLPGIVQALVATPGILPKLTSLHLSGYHSSSCVAKAAEQFVAARRLSGRAICLIG